MKKRKSLLSFADLKTHFSTNSARNFWVPTFKSMSAVRFHHSILCHLLSPAHMGTGGHYGPAYTAEMVWLLAGVPGAMEVDWAPDGKDLHWAHKGFHRSSKVSLSRVPAVFFFLLGKGFSVRKALPWDVEPAHKQHLRRVSTPNPEPKSTKPVLRPCYWEMIIAFWVVQMSHIEPFSWDLLLPWNLWNEQGACSGQGGL